jgi:hypothetical protein
MNKKIIRNTNRKIDKSEMEVMILPLSNDKIDKLKEKIFKINEMIVNIEDYFNNDNFVINILNSELRLLQYKIKNYKNILSNILFLIKDKESFFEKMLKKIEKFEEEDDDFYKNLLINKIETENIIELLENKKKDFYSNIDKETGNYKKNFIERKRTILFNIINDPVYGLNTIKGKSRDFIKQQLFKTIILFSQSPKSFINKFFNILILGGPGSGKSKISEILGKNFFYNLGILSTPKYKRVTRGDLVAGYAGKTSIKTNRLLHSMIEGVLFIDEAYSLTSCIDGKLDPKSSDNYGRESIAEILNFTDEYKGLNIIIAAGYKKDMFNCFLKINEGMPRRFQYHIYLKKLTSTDLYKILKINLKDLSDKNEFLEIYKDKIKMNHIKKLIEILNSSSKHDVFSNQVADIEYLAQIIIEDILTNGGINEYTLNNINIIFQKFLLYKNIPIKIKFKSKDRKSKDIDIDKSRSRSSRRSKRKIRRRTRRKGRSRSRNKYSNINRRRNI